MEIRPLRPDDVDLLRDIDATSESSRYLHVDESGSGLTLTWRIDERPLREKRTDHHPLADDQLFLARQITSGHLEGLAVGIDYDADLRALLLATFDLDRKLLLINDIRVDLDLRRQGIATALMYQAIQAAHERELRALHAITRSDNIPAATFLARAGFKLAGLDTLRDTNHDLVKEQASLLWYHTLQ
jgi:GNAT superfamily N-acetyltransferase